jgi:hypothetical protein
MNEGRFPLHRKGFARYLRDYQGIRFVPVELPDVQTKYSACCYYFGAFYFRRVR